MNENDQGELEQEYIPKENLSESYSTDPNDVVKFTQGLRYRAVDELTNNRKTIPSDPTMLLQVLRDMDQSALTTRKLNIEEKASNDGRAARESYRQLKELLGTRDPLACDSGGHIPVAVQRLNQPSEGISVPEVAMVPGEDFQGEQPLNISNYVAVDD